MGLVPLGMRNLRNPYSVCEINRCSRVGRSVSAQPNNKWREAAASRGEGGPKRLAGGSIAACNLVKWETSVLVETAYGSDAPSFEK